MNSVMVSTRLEASGLGPHVPMTTNTTITGMPGRQKRSHSDLLRPRRSLRKRSLSPATSSSSSSYYSSCNNEPQGPPPAPLYVRLLENLTFVMEVTKHGNNVSYVLRIRRDNGKMLAHGDDYHPSSNHAATGPKHDHWSLSRSFEEYRQFQQRVIKLLDHGHFCSAECPWLFTFVTSYFPRNHLFRYTTNSVTTSRQVMLQQFFQTFQLFLCTKENQMCGVLMDIVAKELVSFLYGDLIASGGSSPLLAHTASLWRCSPFGSVSTTTGGGSGSSEESVCSLSGDEEDDATNSESSSCSSEECRSTVCTLCDSSLYEEAHSGIKTVQAATSGRHLSFSYITRLGCGHLFHDECIVPKLNESLHCPTCGHQETA